MSDRLILHGMSSPNVTKVHLMLEECGLAYETRHVDVFRQGQFDPEFLALNPLGKVPVLEDSRLGQPLAESGAILIWLAEREGKFLPTTQPERAEVLQWVMIQMANYGPMLGQLNHFRMVLRPGTEPYAEARYAAAVEKLYRLLDSRLKNQEGQGREWIAGGDYSIADMAIYPWAYYLEIHGHDPAAYPALIGWRERVAARPAVQRAHARQHEAFAEVVTAARKSATTQDLDRFFGRTDAVPAHDFTAVQEN